MDKEYNLYSDIQLRTKGEIYIGVVGPVRTGKSTFIKRFMENVVLPNIDNEYLLKRTTDELPQAASGKTIMTTEPKFVPLEAVHMTLDNETKVAVRLIDCVGYMVEGAAGHIENDHERMVKTPWFDEEIEFTKAADIGTKKVISDHSTIGIVVTTDGTIGELPRESYINAEERTINELKTINKPFIVLLNSIKPYAKETVNIANEIATKHNVSVLPVNCEQLKKDDILKIFEKVLMEFPIEEINFYVPKWIEMLDINHLLKQEMIKAAKQISSKLLTVKDATYENIYMQSANINKTTLLEKNMSNGNINVLIEVNEECYYQVLSELVGISINDEYQLINNLKDMARLKNEYERVEDAMQNVKLKGYGVVNPLRDEIMLEEPEIIKNGNKYGVKIKAVAPSIHMIKANVNTQIAPIVGSEDQAKDLISFIKENSDKEDGIWGTNIFGKTIEQIVEDGIKTKIAKLSDETQNKMQDTLQKITNDSKGGVICIII